MKFTFSLESVLSVRKHREKIQKLRLAERLSEKNQINDQQAEMKKKLGHYLDNMQRDEFQNVHTVKRHNKHVHETHQKMGELNKQLKEAKNNVDKERQELSVAYKKRHVLEKVREKERKRFSEKIAKLEQKTMDEIATQSYSY